MKSREAILPANSTQARILIVDDHPLVRRGLGQLIADEPDLEVCGEAEDVSEALRQVNDVSPDLVIVDISLKSGNGVDLIKRIKARDEGVKMLVSSMHDESLFAQRVLRAGAMGYISKHEAPETVIHAIRQVLAGGFYLNSQSKDDMLRSVVSGRQTRAGVSIEDLSDRELEVFELIGHGQTTRQIADRLHLSIKTIESHREKIKSKLNLKNAAELSRHAVQWLME